MNKDTVVIGVSAVLGAIAGLYLYHESKKPTIVNIINPNKTKDTRK